MEQINALSDFIKDELPGGADALEVLPPVEIAIRLLRERVVAADVPVFVLKGTDSLATGCISYYTELCRSNGLHDQVNQVEKALLEMRQWQAANLSRVKPPVHKHVPHEVQSLTIEPGHIKPKD